MGNTLGMPSPKTKQMQELSKEQLANELHPAQKVHVQYGETYNVARSAEFNRSQKLPRRIGLTLGVVALSSYFWTIYSLKQEKLGPEFDVRIDDSESENKNL